MDAARCIQEDENALHRSAAAGKLRLCGHCKLQWPICAAYLLPMILPESHRSRTKP